MSEKDGGPAFPVPVAVDNMDGLNYGTGGMSLRDYFAGQALAGVLRYPAIERTIEIASAQGGDEAVNAQLSRISFSLADAMLAERAK